MLYTIKINRIANSNAISNETVFVIVSRLHKPLYKLTATAAAASTNVGWPGGAPIFFRRRWRGGGGGTLPAGGEGGIRRLRGLQTSFVL